MLVDPPLNEKPRKTAFDPNDSTGVKHTKIGLWDLYVKVDDDRIPYIARLWPAISLQPYIQSAPYVLRMIKDIVSIPKCWPLLAIYILTELAAALIPALTLSYSGQMLPIVQAAIDHRTVDTSLLASVVFGTFISSLAGRILLHVGSRVTPPLRQRIKQHYSVHIFYAFSRLDVPTFDDPAIQHKLLRAKEPDDMENGSIVFWAVAATLRVFSVVIQLLSQLLVLINLLKGQPDGFLFAFISFAQGLFQWKKMNGYAISDSAWAATTSDPDFLRSQGLMKTIQRGIHRQEIVAGGIASFLFTRYRESIAQLSDHPRDFYEAFSRHQQGGFPVALIFEETLYALPQIVSALRAVRQPSSIPLSLVSLNFVTGTMTSFAHTFFALRTETGSMAEMLTSVRHLYEVAKIPNRVKVDHHLPKEKTEKDTSQTPTEFNQDPDDPTFGIPFPEDQRSLELGISVEFRKVSFKYPGSDTYALKNVSFKIERGQLCVIVGTNGSGKSTILKLIARLYDPVEGEIRINGQDIRTLRLADLRNAIAVLFQDYTLFPLNIRDNISLGDPPHSSDPSRVQKAAELGGADAFIQRLPDKYETYIQRPVGDQYSSIPETTSSMPGQTVIDVIRAAGRIGNSVIGLSGGEMQRIALSRTFMRSAVPHGGPGLLLYDEPSSSLDPTAEHDLFERLRQLRGSKTMIFSSHRFGHLTRHADLILYMNDSVVIEGGTHDQLLRQQGEYARIWMLQARALI